MTALPCVAGISRPEPVPARPDPGALHHLLAAAEALDAEGRSEDARRVRDLARRLGLSGGR